MGKTGSIDEKLVVALLESEQMNFLAAGALSDTDEAEMYHASLLTTLDAHRAISDASFVTILYAEHRSVALEYANATDPTQKVSLKRAMDQAAAAQKTLSIMTDPDAYKRHVDELPPDDRECDPPKDNVRRFILSQSARLRDRIKLGLDASDEKLAILHQRSRNLKNAQARYITAQREVLGENWRQATDYSIPLLPSEREH